MCFAVCAAYDALTMAGLAACLSLTVTKCACIALVAVLNKALPMAMVADGLALSMALVTANLPFACAALAGDATRLVASLAILVEDVILFECFKRHTCIFCGKSFSWVFVGVGFNNSLARGLVGHGIVYARCGFVVYIQFIC